MCLNRICDSMWPIPNLAWPSVYCEIVTDGKDQEEDAEESDAET